ncbi:uncharacterized protein LOC118204950 isoform X2 [Stegodyphus dumicola]|uniref:uncharacterized protein LOC118204950 isoform X2 n=1 Tax=Stegodyphus dumicola TaxID=202533 RepID=UPI0015B31F2E|nr:uncharacterized protein LOC118204950 isoform X2 [Stegodyphus dumicola]
MADKMISMRLEDVKEKIRSALPLGRKKCSLDEFNRRFRSIIGHRLPFKEFQYQTDVEFLKSIPDTVSINRIKSGEYFVQGVKLKRTDSFGSDLSTHCRLYGLTSAHCKSSDFKDSTKPPFASIHKSVASFMSEVPEEPESSSVVPEDVRRNLLKLLEMYPCGMCASDFPSLYEEVNHVTFDHRGLGFDCLADFIDTVSDIFKRKHIAEIKRDWLIVPADMEDQTFAKNADLSKDNSLVVDNVIQNIRKMLVKYYPGGIPLDSFLHVYTMNYQDIISFRDLGFDNIQCFLSSISKYVPLRMDKDNICKSSYVYFVTDAAPEIFGEETLPHDIVPPDSEFSLQELPSNIDYSKYFAVYLSQVYSPEDFYIQIVGRDTTDAVEIVQDKLHKFCRGPWSYNYKMRNAHIKVGAICAALFTDNFWYRVKIVSIPSMEMVEVSHLL